MGGGREALHTARNKRHLELWHINKSGSGGGDDGQEGKQWPKPKEGGMTLEKCLTRFFPLHFPKDAYLASLENAPRPDVSLQGKELK